MSCETSCETVTGSVVALLDGELAEGGLLKLKRKIHMHALEYTNDYLNEREHDDYCYDETQHKSNNLLEAFVEAVGEAPAGEVAIVPREGARCHVCHSPCHVDCTVQHAATHPEAAFSPLTP